MSRNENFYRKFVTFRPKKAEPFGPMVTPHLVWSGDKTRRDVRIEHDAFRLEHIMLYQVVWSRDADLRLRT
jgi:hypothetical protein